MQLLALILDKVGRALFSVDRNNECCSLALRIILLSRRGKKSTINYRNSCKECLHECLHKRGSWRKRRRKARTFSLEEPDVRMCASTRKIVQQDCKPVRPVYFFIVLIALLAARRLHKVASGPGVPTCSPVIEWAHALWYGNGHHPHVDRCLKVTLCHRFPLVQTLEPAASGYAPASAHPSPN